MPPEYAGSARAGDEWERPFRMIVNGGIEFADDVIQHSRRGCENRSAITAIRRWGDRKGGFLKKKTPLFAVGGHTPPAEVLPDRAVAHQDNLVGVGALFISGTAATDAAAVVAHADKRAFVKR